MYTERLVDHFRNPRHLGELTDANGIGTIGDPGCGDFLRIYIRVAGDVIKEISFLCQGCPAAIASASAACELAFGRTLEEAAQITEESISEHLGGLPGEKLHCSNLGAMALKYAIADFRGIRTGDEAPCISTIERVRSAARMLALSAGLIDTAVQIQIRKLPPETAIGSTSARDYPIWKGKEGIVEARLLDGVGHAFGPAPVDFEGGLGTVLALDLGGNDKAAAARRGLFVAAVNALCSHLGLASHTVHCRDAGPEECAKDLVEIVRLGSPEDSRIALIGCQPRMAEALAAHYSLRVIDLDPDNIGKSFGGAIVEGEEMTADALNWCDIALVTGSTLVNGTIDRFVDLKCHNVFYGVTIAGAAALLGLNRFCPRAM